ncbi:hypothetical protein FRB90_004115 [Tulasnella sp. 427]|nr:hypothetical protein FRB90_004115 [Tulasnella sp. 427]
MQTLRTHFRPRPSAFSRYLHNAQKQAIILNKCQLRQNSQLSGSTAEPTKLAKIIEDTIRSTGPIPVSQYIQLCLSHPTEGYYMKGDIFGTKGDFITSPEISQAFGELVGIWLLSRWLEDGKPSRVQLVELGPGRGTLMDDILRATRGFKEFASALTSVTLVETSQQLRKKQKDKLEKYGVPLSWHDRIEDVPQDAYSLVVAHEFFDALPIHILQKTDRGFREVLVGLDSTTLIKNRSALDIDTTLASPIVKRTSSRLNFTLSADASPITSVLVASSPRFANLPTGSRIEVSPASFKIAHQVGNLIQKGGAALVVDYGGPQLYGNSFRAFRKHKVVEVFDEPGSSDLTTNVDFAYLKEAMSQPGLHHGLLSQRDFLLKMGIEVRCNALMRNAPSDERRKDIEHSVKRLIDPIGMGTQYQVMAVTPKEKPYPFLEAMGTGMQRLVEKGATTAKAV